MHPNIHIVFYDDDCMLCSNIVIFLIKKNKKSNLYFSSLNSDLAKSLLPINYLNGTLDTIILYEKSKIYIKFQAVYKIISIVNFLPFHLLKLIMKLMPIKLGDFFYDIFAKYRHFWVKKNTACPISTDNIVKPFILEKNVTLSKL